jgi:predicted aspartyl protease
MEIEFPYTEEESRTFGVVKRPRMLMRIFSGTKGIWIPIKDTLVDTGADSTVLPRFIGELLVEDITTGKYSEIKGVVPGSVLVAYIHELKIKVGDREFEAPVAIADSNDVPSIFGRINSLDLFDANFLKGEKIKLQWGE